MEQDVIIEMKKINKGYLLGTEKVPVLKNVDFRVRKGEYVAILGPCGRGFPISGPSGSGKTGAGGLYACDRNAWTFTQAAP